MAGRSAPIGEIGRELGELDFEPDELLASLYPLEPAQPAAEAPAVGTPAAIPTFDEAETDTLLKAPRSGTEPALSPAAPPFAVVPPRRQSIIPFVPEVPARDPEPANAEPHHSRAAFSSESSQPSRPLEPVELASDAPDVVASEELEILEELVELPPERHESLSFPHERVSVAHLEHLGLTETFVRIAEVLEAEQAGSLSPPERAELSLVASELFTMAGQITRARVLLDKTPHAHLPLFATQRRQLAFDPENLAPYGQHIRNDLRLATTHEARRHLMTLYVDVARRLKLEEAEQRRHLELSLRAFPTDARLQLARLVGSLTEAEPGVTLRGRSPVVADALGRPEVLQELQCLRKRSPLPADAQHPLTVGLKVRHAIRTGNPGELATALTSLRAITPFEDAATWLLVALLRTQPESQALCCTLLQELAQNDQFDAKLACLEHELGSKDAPPSAVEVFAQDVTASLSREDQLCLAVAAKADRATLSLLSSNLRDAVATRPGLLPLLFAIQHGLLDTPLTDGHDRIADAASALGHGIGLVAPPPPLASSTPHSEGLSLEALLALSQYENANGEDSLSRVLRLWHVAHGTSLTSIATALAAMVADWPEREQPFVQILCALMLDRDGSRGQARSALTQCMSQSGPLEVGYRALAAQGLDDAERELLGELVATLPPSPRRTMLELESGFAPETSLPAALLPLITVLEDSEESWNALLAASTPSDEQLLVATLLRHNTKGSPTPEPAFTARDFLESLLTSARDIGQVPHPSPLPWESLAAQWHSPVAARVAALLAETQGTRPSHLQDATSTELARLYDGLLAAASAGAALELRDTAGQVASRLDGPDRYAYAWLALRPWSHIQDEAPPRMALSSLVGDVPANERWALCKLRREATAAHDDSRLLDFLAKLRTLAASPLDQATIVQRMAEAAARLQQWEQAASLLDEAVLLFPEHLVALSMRAEFLEARGEGRRAAEAFEALAEASCMPSHKIAAWLQAADLFEASTAPGTRHQDSIRCLQSALRLDPLAQQPQEALVRLFHTAERFDDLLELLTQQLLTAERTDLRLSLELERARVLLRLGRDSEAQLGLERALSIDPDHEEALRLFSQLLEQSHNFAAAENPLLKLATTTQNPEQSLFAYRRLAALYDSQLEQPQRAEVAYREVLKLAPGAPEGDRLVALLLRQNDAQGALEVLLSLLDGTEDPLVSRDRHLELARIYDEVLGERRRAEEVLTKTRRRWQNDGTVLKALATFYRRGKDGSALSTLLDRSLTEARRALNGGRFEPGSFDVIASVGELRDQPALTCVARAALSVLSGQPAELGGLGLVALGPQRSEPLAPEVLSLPLRALLKRTGWLLNASAPVDLRALRATPLAETHSSLCKRLDEYAHALGLLDVTWYLSPAVGAVCQPLGSRPLTAVVGPGFLALTDPRVQDALVIRALKILESNAPALANAAPADQGPLLMAYLSLYLPDWLPAGIDAARLQQLRQSMQPLLPADSEHDMPALAADVIGSIGNRASQLGLALQQWGSRTALLALGAPDVVLTAIAAASGQLDRFTATPDQRIKWLLRNPEARDLLVFSVTEEYVLARTTNP